MVLLDLFSGIGGFALGLQEAGFHFDTHYFSEIDKHAIANYRHNFKSSTYVGTVESILGDTLQRPDIITFGSPCQDFSLAGRRDGMAGQRSSLVLEAIRLIAECRPRVFIWENVKGVFSSNHGADFWAIIQCFADIGGYELEWQLVNTRWILPQNRERIYLIGHLAGFNRSQVFPIREDDIISFASKSNHARSGNVANCITGGGHSGGLHSDATYIKQVNPNKTWGTQPRQQDRIYDEDGIMPALGSARLDSKVNILSRSRGFNKGGEKNDCPTIGSCSFEQNNLLKENEHLRRLTEIECERLQGFPDDWTKYGNYDGIVKEIPKTHRYKMIGNAVTAKMVTLITKKITL